MAVTKLNRKNKNGKKTIRFLADVYVCGVKMTTRTFETRAEAEVWHDAEKKRLTSGGNIQSDRDVEFTFGDCVHAYLNDDEGLLKNRKASRQSMMARMTYFTDCPVVNVQMQTSRRTRWTFGWIGCSNTQQPKTRRAEVSKLS